MSIQRIFYPAISYNDRSTVTFRMFDGMYEESFTEADIVRRRRFNELNPYTKEYQEKDSIRSRCYHNKIWMDYYRYRLSTMNGVRFLKDPIIITLFPLKTENLPHPDREKFLQAVLKVKLKIKQ